MFIQREAGPDLVVIRSVSLQDTTQVRLAEHDHVIEAFATYRSDECCREAPDHGSHPRLSRAAHVASYQKVKSVRAGGPTSKDASRANSEGLALALFSVRPEKDRFPDKSKTQQNPRLVSLENPSDNSK